MKNLLKVSILAILLVNCGVEFEDPRIGDSVHGDYLESVLAFQEEYGIVTDIPVTIGHLRAGRAAEAATYLWENRPVCEVFVDVDWHEKHKDNYYKKEHLIFHEFGHCFGLKHDNERTEEGVPVSIMNSTSFSTDVLEDWYIPERDYYVEELRGKLNND